jgi:glutamate/tyrosine decarboxylase-like PLP-dependent enzyme
VELKEVKLSEGYYVMDPEKAVEMVDENTICVAAILGSTLNGEFEDVKRLNDLLVEKKKETGQVFLLLSIYIYMVLHILVAGSFPNRARMLLLNCSIKETEQCNTL